MKAKRTRDTDDVEEKPIDNVADAPAKKRKRDKDGEVDGSAAVKKSKKDKKDKKKDKKESRKDKKEKRKDLQDLPEEDTPADEDAAEEPEPETKKVKKSDASKKEKEDKKSEKKEKKREKKQKKKEEESKPKENGEATADADGNDSPIDLDQTTAEKADRHIVFVGNLPYTATAATISAHFASLNPIAVRCLKNRDDDKPCRGIAFVEFGKVWHQRTCLDKFHHSMFNDGQSAPRKINVELTAGGGGKNKDRQEKIREKNQKLDENRAKRIEREKNAKDENKSKQPQQQSSMEDSIHPSRRGRVPGMGY